MGNDYSTVPVAASLFVGHPDDAAAQFYALAHMAGGVLQLHRDKKRIDELWTADHKRALSDYHANLPFMKTRYLQEGGQAVLWHDAEGKRATLWNFTDREISLPGSVRNETIGEGLAPAGSYPLRAGYVYSITDCELPVAVG